MLPLFKLWGGLHSTLHHSKARQPCQQLFLESLKAPPSRLSAYQPPSRHVFCLQMERAAGFHRRLDPFLGPHATNLYIEDDDFHQQASNTSSLTNISTYD